MDHLTPTIQKDFDKFISTITKLPRIKDRSQLLWYKSNEIDNLDAQPIDDEDL